MRFAILYRAHNRGVFGKTAVLRGERDLCKILIHHATRADIRVSDLGIAHLTVGKANVQPRGTDQRMRIFLFKCANVFYALYANGVALFFGREAEAVEDNESGKFFVVFQSIFPYCVLSRFLNIGFDSRTGCAEADHHLPKSNL